MNSAVKKGSRVSTNVAERKNLCVMVMFEFGNTTKVALVSTIVQL